MVYRPLSAGAERLVQDASTLNPGPHLQELAAQLAGGLVGEVRVQHGGTRAGRQQDRVALQEREAGLPRREP